MNTEESKKENNDKHDKHDSSESKKTHKTEKMESATILVPESHMGSQRMKNLTAAAILLAGLFVGSLFVDVFQLFAGRGFSERALRKADVVEMAGKTWVAYTDPKVTVKVLTDKSCEQCAPDQALLALRRVLPTLEAQSFDVDSSAGKELARTGQVVTLPAFFFAPEVDKTSIFAQAEPLFTKREDGWYALDVSRLGLPVGKYLELPAVGENDMRRGNLDAKVKIVEFSDWQCPFCKMLHPAIKEVLGQYGDQVVYVYKDFPLPFHAQAENAALATRCANEQGKFFEYGDILFSKQDEWGKTTGTQSFKNYARTLALSTPQFNQCLDDKKYLEQVNTDKALGEKFGVSGTPGTFVNGTFFGGAIPVDQLKSAIDEELKK